MTAADPALDALMLPFASGQLAWPPAGGALFLHAREGWPLHRQPLPGLADEEVHRISVERDYARRFDATPAAPTA
jgi:16S rRNA (guanine1207-N2)-methyltransferase